VIDPETLVNKNIFDIQSLVSEFSFRLRAIPSMQIHVKIWRAAESYEGDHFTCTCSHFVKTPTQASAYSPGSSFTSSAEEAASKAIRDMITSVVGAIGEGRTPSESWLEVNDDF